MPRPTASLRTAALLSLGPAVSNGFARFAYALLLPPMQADLGWSYTAAGAMNSFNAMGYLAGSLLAFHAIARLGAGRLFVWGMFMTAAAVGATGLASNYELMGALRFVAGLAGAMVFISGGVLAAAIFPDDVRRAAAAIAVYFAGGGIGIVLPGITLPWLFALQGNAAWTWAWIAMGAAGLAMSVVALSAVPPAPPRGSAVTAGTWSIRGFVALFVSYFVFGVGYIAYMTFIIAWMRGHGSGPAAVAATWGGLGAACIAAQRVWRGPMAHWSGGRPVAAMLATLTVGATLPLLSTALPVTILSAALFGSSLFSTPAAITAYAKKWLPARLWGKAVAGFTVAFSAGQILGPVLTGMVSDATGSLFSGLVISAALLALGAGLALLQRDPPGGAARVD